jgi:hypothetical protein
VRAQALDEAVENGAVCECPVHDAGPNGAFGRVAMVRA